MLVDSPPQVMLNAIDLDENLIKVPLRADAGSLFSQLRCVEGTELSAPLPNGLVREPDPALGHHRLEVAIA
jgi:hypothetical protein